MTKIDIELIVAVAGIVGFVGSSIAWFRTITIKEYAHKRDIEHLRRNQEQFILNLTNLASDLTEQMTEIKAMLFAVLGKK